MAAAKQNKPIVWVIGGFDPLGASGLMADNRAASILGGHCSAIVTCITAQNSAAFFRMVPTDIELMEAQWQALAAQTIPAVIKIGLIANASQARWLGEKLAEHKQRLLKRHEATFVIYDPVLASSSGHDLVSNETLASIKRFLLPQVDLITPNADEAKILRNQDSKVIFDLAEMGRWLAQQFDLAVLVKGGHLNHLGFALDCYVARPNVIDPREPATSFFMRSSFQKNRNLRGTGCTLASLISAFLAANNTVCDALVYSKAIINQAISRSEPIGNDQGAVTELALPQSSDFLPWILPLDHHITDEPLSEYQSQGSEFTGCGEKLGLYPVVDSISWMRQLLELGVETIQLRIKKPVQTEVESQVVQAIALGHQYQARVFINDYWQLAIKHQAYGVHLGQEDLQTADLEQIRQAGLRLGISTHGIYEAQLAAQLSPSYIAIGHIFPTRTKQMASNPQGIKNLKRQVQLFSDQQNLVAIGGINVERVAEVVATGIGSVAVVTAISLSEDVPKTTRWLLSEIGAGYGKSMRARATKDVVHV